MLEKMIALALMVFLGYIVFGEGTQETTKKPVEITFLHSGDTDFTAELGATKFDYALAKLKADFPDAKVDMIKLDLSDGSTLTMDAMLAAGQAPNVYQDTIVRSSKYMVPEYAMPLDGLIRDIDKYDPRALEPYRRGGKLLALPIPGGAQGMAVNLEIMADIGYTVPGRWTVDDFLTMAKLVKDKYHGQKWATGMFAGNQSGDYLINNWFASFGVKYYSAGDYSHSTIAETGGAKVYEFFQKLVKNGYVPPNSATLVDDDYVIQWAKGDIAATAWFEGWSAPYDKTVISQGLRDKPVPYKFVPFPRAAGVENVPTYMMPGAFVVHSGTDAQNEVAGRFVEYLNDANVQSAFVMMNGDIANRTDVSVVNGNPHIRQIQSIVKAGGLFDVGLTTPMFTPRRSTHFPILQKVLNLAISPDEAIAAYEKALNEAK